VLYHTTDNAGVTEINPSMDQMRSLIARLDHPEIETTEYPDITLVHNPSGWSISLFPSGIVTMENLDEADMAPRFMDGITREEALQLWSDLAKGALAALLERNWKQAAD
jgi:hypothetical protein